MEIAVLEVPAFPREGPRLVPELFLVFLGVNCILATGSLVQAFGLERRLRLEAVFAKEDLERWFAIGREQESDSLFLIREWIDAFRVDSYADFGSDLRHDMLTHLRSEYLREHYPSEAVDAETDVVPTPA